MPLRMKEWMREGTGRVYRRRRPVRKLARVEVANQKRSATTLFQALRYRAHASPTIHICTHGVFRASYVLGSLAGVMMPAWISAAVILFVSAKALSEVLELWLRDPTKKHLADLLAEGWLQLSYAEPMSVVHVPIRSVRALFDIVLGPKTFSRRAFVRSGTLGTILLITSLGIGGILERSAFLGAAPWKVYDISIQAARQELAKPAGDKKIPAVDEFYRALLRHDGAKLKAGYCVGIVALVLMMNALLDFAGVVLTRQLLRELEEINGVITLLAALGFDLFLALSVSAFTILVIIFAAFPFLWPMLYALRILPRWSLPATLLIAAVTALLFWYIVGLAVRIIVVIAILPTLVVGALLAYAVVGVPFRKQLHCGISAVFLRVAESGKGAFAYVLALLGAVATLVTLLSQLIGKL